MKKVKTISCVLMCAMLISLAACGNNKSADAREDVRFKDQAVALETVCSEDYDMAEYVVNNEADEFCDDSSMKETATPVTSQKLIKRRTISIDTTEFDDMLQNMNDIVKSHNGYVESSNISGTGSNGSRRTANYVFRVPSSDYEACCAMISQNCTVTFMNETTDDVTSAYIDIESHLTALRAEYDTLIDLLEKSEDLDTIIRLQKELASVRYEIENYEGNKRYYDDQVSFSTITVSINEITVSEVVEEKPLELTFKERISESYDNMKKDLRNDYESTVLDIIENLPGVIVRVIVWIILIIVGIIVIKKIRGVRRSSDKNEKVAVKNEICNTESDKSKCGSGKPNSREDK